MNNCLDRTRPLLLAAFGLLLLANLLGETPVELGGGSLLVAFRDPDGNFYEIIGPRR